jgi:D-amino peptidase
MQGIDSTFHAAIFIGYHAATTNPEGVRAHTFSSARYTRVAINGMDAAESTVNAAIAGHFGVPVVLISGDDAAVAELRALVPGAEGAVVKRAISFHSAATLTPEAGQALIRDATTRALRNLRRVQPYRLPSGPVTLDVTFKDYRPSQILAYLPIVERPTSHSIRFVGRDILEVSRFLQFLGGYSTDLSP